MDVGNKSLKAIFGKMDIELNIPSVIARDVQDCPVIGIEELDNQDPVEGIDIGLHFPYFKKYKCYLSCGPFSNQMLIQPN